MSKQRSAGIAFILVFVFFAAFTALQSQRVALGNVDGDHPAESLYFLEEHPRIGVLIGLASIGIAISLAVGLLALWDSAYAAETALLPKLAFLFGAFGAAFFFLAGVMFANAPGTLAHMANMQREYGIAGYLAVQMAGTQGAAASAAFSLNLFASLLSVYNLRVPKFPKLLSVLGFAGLVNFALALVGPLHRALPDWMHLVYIFCFVLVQMWVLGLGIWTLRKPA
jgi:hypothetical protein